MNCRLLQYVLVYSESTKWAVQNAVGVAVPMLFVVIGSISFHGACAAILFYGVSSQAFSIDRTIGGRLFGGLVWITVVLTGGLVGFAITSLAWLARGSDVPYQGLDAIPPGENPSLSSAFWILLMVLHVVFDTVLMYTRVHPSGLNPIFASICQIFSSVVTIYGMAFMPTYGQEKFWTQAYSPLIKAHLLVLLGMILGSVLVYVKSSHDSLREQLGDMCTEIGRIFTSHASGLNIVLCSSSQETDSRYKSLLDWNHKVQRVKSVDQVMRMSLDAQTECSLCSFEPAWWQLCSQPGASSKKYGDAIAKFQVLLQTMNALDTITSPMIQNVIEKGAEQSSAEWKILETAASSLALLSAVIEGMASPLKCMPLGRACHGDDISWRPHTLEFWNSAMKTVSDTIRGSIMSLRDSTLSGLGKILQEEHAKGSDVRGFAITLLTLVEHLIDECIGVEIAVAKALEISSSDVYILGQYGEEPQQGLSFRPGDTNNPLQRMKMHMENLFENPYMSSMMNNISLASGFRVWNAQLQSIVEMMAQARKWFDRIFKGMSCDVPADRDPIISLNQVHQRNLYIKLFVGYNIATVGVILIGWYCYAGSDDYAQNAESVFNWFSKWQPYYFVLAFAICAQDTVDSSAIKAILRVSLIGLGGSLGYATMLNGTLAQNPYFLFFMAVIVNGFFGIFSPISFDFRYSLFLVLYTWAGVATCQYTGICCTAGSASMYLGKFVSTALGAVYAFVISNVVFPVFSSQIAFELEASLLSTYMSAIEESYGQGALLLKKPETDTKELLHPNYPYIGLKKNAKYHRRMVHYITTAVRKRLALLSRIYNEVETKAFDKHFMFFIRLTLIPLPESLRLILGRLTGIGAYVNISIKTLKCSFLRSPGSLSSEIFMRTMLEQTDPCLIGVRQVQQKIINILIRKQIHMEDINNLQQDLDFLVSTRKNLYDQYIKVENELRKCNDWNYGDLRCLTWFGMLIHAIKEIEALGLAIIQPDGPYQTKGGKWIFPRVNLGKIYS